MTQSSSSALPLLGGVFSVSSCCLIIAILGIVAYYYTQSKVSSAESSSTTTSTTPAPVTTLKPASTTPVPVSTVTPSPTTPTPTPTVAQTTLPSAPTLPPTTPPGIIASNDTINTYSIKPLELQSGMSGLDAILSTFNRFDASDSVGYDYDTSMVGAKDISTVAGKCYSDPTCVAFNKGGWLKNKIDPSGLSQNNDQSLWVKVGVPVSGQSINLSGKGVIYNPFGGPTTPAPRAPDVITVNTPSQFQTPQRTTDVITTNQVPTFSAGSALGIQPVQQSAPSPQQPATTTGGFVATAMAGLIGSIFDTYPNSDSSGNDYDTSLVGGSLNTIAAKCANDSNCVAFNSAGWIKNAINKDGLSPSGNTLYVKKGIPVKVTNNI
jgi:hypothetical protein